MDPFDALVSTRDMIWSLIVLGPVGLATQYFVDPRMDVSSAASEAAIETSHARYRHTTSPQSDTAASLVGWLIPEGNKPHWLSRCFQHGDDTLHFKLYVPSSYKGEPMPMVVMLHGA